MIITLGLKDHSSVETGVPSIFSPSLICIINKQILTLDNVSHTALDANSI